MYESELIIAVRNGNGKIIASQTFEEFMNGRKNIEILNYYTGQKLFDILFDDLGIIRYEDNVFALKTIFQLNPEKTTMSLLGKIAEAVIVRRCREDEEINKKWLSIARRKKAKSKTAERFQEEYPLTLLFSAVSDKDYQDMIHTICSRIRFRKVVTTEVGGYREVPSAQLAEIFCKEGCEDVGNSDDIAQAFQMARAAKGEDGMLFCVGSLYLVGEIKAILLKETGK